MSSGSSISVQSSTASRIRQFGLYRTIDARTEEFLRLSRKRQIRQGCACAAASTAITVTVVVVVLFVYEFSLNSETNLENSLKSNWLSLMNDTSENSSFDSKLSEANIDRTTLKLLPLLIKAIRKNSILEKLIEDHSNTSNPYENTEKVDDVDKNTITTDWFKFPTTKLYAIEYKTSPVVYYKHPTTNIEYYTKIRKIRDYQRVFNYIDKMISEKVYIGATKPMPKGEFYTGKPEIMLKSVKKPYYSKTTTHKNDKKTTTTIYEADKDSDAECKCPKKFGLLLNKIYSSVLKLLPETTTNIATNAKKAKNISSIRKHKGPKKHIFVNHYLKKKIPNTTPTSLIKFMESIEPEKTWTNEPKPEQVTDANSYNNNIPQFLYHDTKIDSSEITTQTTNYIDGTHNIDDEVPKTTQSMQYLNKYKDIIYRKNLLRNQYTLAERSKNYNNDVNDIFQRKNTVSTLTPTELQMMVQHQIELIKNKLNEYKNLENRYSLKKHKNKTSFVNAIFPQTIYDQQKFTLYANSNDKQNGTTYYEKTKPFQVSRNQAKNIVINDKLLLDYIKSKLADSKEIHNSTTPTTQIQRSSNNYNNIEMQIYNETSLYTDEMNGNKNEHTNFLIKSDLKEFLNKNFRKTDEPDTISQLEGLNKTNKQQKDHLEIERSNNKSIYHFIENEIKYPVSQSSDVNSFENELTNSDNNIQLIQKTLQKPTSNFDEIIYQNLRADKKRISLDVMLEEDEFKILNSSEEFKNDTKHASLGKNKNVIESPRNVTLKKDKDLKASWEDLSSPKNIPTWKSILLEHTTPYLEIHRTELRDSQAPDDEYNMNVNNNVYDIIDTI